MRHFLPAFLTSTILAATAAAAVLAAAPAPSGPKAPAAAAPAATAEAAAAPAAAARTAAAPAAAAEVRIDNFSFAPATVTVAAGTTVTWVNHDDIPHNVASTDKLFKSKTLDTDEKFSYTFARPGKYPYFCSIHPKMTGEIDVR